MKKSILTILLITLSLKAFTQVAIGTNAPDASAALDITSTTHGFLPPRMKKAQIKAIKNPEEGLMVYCMDCNPKAVYYNDGKAFVNLNTGEPSDMKDTDVYSPATGRVWMDRNLGASRVARSSTDSLAYGDYYQWGRNSDGHEKHDSSVELGPVLAGSEGDKFITTNKEPYDWLKIQDNTRWNVGTEENPIKTKNDPCPVGYRIPTKKEWQYELSSWEIKNMMGAFKSPLKLTLSGYRSHRDTEGEKGSRGLYSSSFATSSRTHFLHLDNNIAKPWSANRSQAFAVRCIME